MLYPLWSFGAPNLFSNFEMLSTYKHCTDFKLKVKVYPSSGSAPCNFCSDVYTLHMDSVQEIRAIKVEETVGNESTYVNRMDLSVYLMEKANSLGFASEARAALLEVITRLSDVKYTRP